MTTDCQSKDCHSIGDKCISSKWICNETKHHNEFPQNKELKRFTAHKIFPHHVIMMDGSSYQGQ